MHSSVIDRCSASGTDAVRQEQTSLSFTDGRLGSMAAHTEVVRGNMTMVRPTFRSRRSGIGHGADAAS